MRRTMSNPYPDAPWYSTFGTMSRFRPQYAASTASVRFATLMFVMLLVVTAAPRAQPSTYERGDFRSADGSGPGALTVGIGAAFSPSGQDNGFQRIRLAPHLSLAPSEIWELKAEVPLEVAWSTLYGTDATDTAWPEISGRLGLSAQWHKRSMPWLCTAEARFALPAAGALQIFPQEGNTHKSVMGIEAFGKESLGLGAGLMRIMDPVILGASLDLGLIVPPRAEAEATDNAASVMLRLGLSLTEAINTRIAAGFALYPGFELNLATGKDNRFRAFLGLQLWAALVQGTAWVRMGSEEYTEAGMRQTAVTADFMHRFAFPFSTSSEPKSKD